MGYATTGQSRGCLVAACPAAPAPRPARSRARHFSYVRQCDRNAAVLAGDGICLPDTAWRARRQWVAVDHVPDHVEAVVGHGRIALGAVDRLPVALALLLEASVADLGNDV